MAAILQTTFSNTFLWMKSFVFWFEFHWSLFLRVQLTMVWYRTGDKLFSEPMLTQFIDACKRHNGEMSKWLWQFIGGCRVSFQRLFWCGFVPRVNNCSDVIMIAMASQITSLGIFYSFGRRSKKTSKPRVTGRWPVNSPHKGKVTQKMFPFDDVIMISTNLRTGMASWLLIRYGNYLCKTWTTSKPQIYVFVSFTVIGVS